MTDEMDALSELWADPDNGWTVHRFTRRKTVLTARWTPLNPSVAELKALRGLPGPHQGGALAELKRRLPSSGELELGAFDVDEARGFLEKARAAGLRIEARDVTEVSYLPFNVKTRMAWIIEDAERSVRVAERMMAAGMPVVDVEP